MVNPAMPLLNWQVDYTERERKKFKYVFGGTYRNQWTKLKSAGPTTFTARLNVRIPVDNTTFWGGAWAIRDQIGPLQMTGGYFNTSVQLFLEQGRFLQAGISLGALQYGLNSNPDEIRLNDPDDELVTALQQNQWFFDPGFGVMYSSPQFYFGASIPRVLTNRFNSLISTSEDDIPFVNAPHFYGMAGTFIILSRTNRKSRRSDLSSYETMLEPSVWVKYVNRQPLLVDVNLKYQIKINRGYSDAWLALGGNTNKAFRAQVGWVLPVTEDSPLIFKWNITYGQQIGVSQYFGPTLEIGLVTLIRPS